METAGKLVDDEELKEALKEQGLGTPATRAAIIETLLARGYVTREKKALAATDLGRYLVALVRDRGLKSAGADGRVGGEAPGDRARPPRPAPVHGGDRPVHRRGHPLRRGGRRRSEPGSATARAAAGRSSRARRGFGCSGWSEGCPFVLWREYRGHPLGDEQIRELLQRRVLLRPMTFGDAGEVILSLTDSGALTEIPVPSRPAATTGEGRGTEARERTHGAGRPSGSERPPSDGAGSSQGERRPAKPAGGLGPCPLCGSEVIEQEKSYGCSGWRDGCKFAIWKTIAGKQISARTAQALLRRGRSPVLKGFKSKSGKAFDARLKLDQGEVRFDFGPEPVLVVSCPTGEVRRTMVDLRPMTAADLADGMRLKAEAGWNQVEADWRRFLALGGEGCFVAERQGRVVGSVTTCQFGSIGWVAMLLVEKAQRGAGSGGSC